MDYTTRSSRLDSDTGTEPEIRSERERWKSHHLYKSNTKLKLEAMCRDLRIPVALEKHQLVNLICNTKDLRKRWSRMPSSSAFALVVMPNRSDRNQRVLGLTTSKQSH